MDVKTCFMQASGIDSFQRIDDTHVLDIFLGIDHMSRYTMFLIFDSEPESLPSSQMVSVFVGKRNDGKWGLSFALNDNEFEDVFFHLCSDIIESSRYVSSNTAGAVHVGKRYKQWQDMLAKYRGNMLSEDEIKGLIGEILFLKDFLLLQYGEVSSVNAWIGPEMADQDFVFSDVWYEVKATASGANSIKVSSIEQLDVAIDGELIIVFLDKTSKANKAGITINKLYNDVLEILQEESCRQKFSSILLKRGYYGRIEYDDYAYQLAGIRRYQVRREFPSIRREMLPGAVAAANYSLSLAALAAYQKED